MATRLERALTERFTDPRQQALHAEMERNSRQYWASIEAHRHASDPGFGKCREARRLLRRAVAWERLRRDLVLIHAAVDTPVGVTVEERPLVKLNDVSVFTRVQESKAIDFLERIHDGKN